MNHYVYQLVGPDGVPFYVGAASTEHRLRLHLSRARRGIGAVARKIRELDYQISMEKLVEGISCATARWFERHLIETMSGLANECAGGAGAVPGWNHTPEAREKIAAANRGLKKDAATRAKIAVKARLRRWPPEHRARFSETITCSHCGKSGGRNGMQRWHFDRCSVRR